MGTLMAEAVFQGHGHPQPPRASAVEVARAHDCRSVLCDVGDEIPIHTLSAETLMMRTTKREETKK